MQDAYEVMDWFASEPWCDGNLGMFGGSYLGATQYMAAASGSPHLKAIIPAVAPSDTYAFAWGGGIFRNDFLREWTDLTVRLDTTAGVAPVDDDYNHALLKAALRAHGQNYNTFDQCSQLPYRDGFIEALDIEMYEACSSISYLEEISESGVAIYHLGGWMDCFTRDAFVLFENLENPQRLAMGPWFHQQRHEFDDLGEHLRWFDRWLKGIDTGVEEEPPIHYYTLGADNEQAWRSSSSWPLAEEVRQKWHFEGTDHGPSAGKLSRHVPANRAPAEYTVDYSTTSGTSNRWTNGYGGPLGYSDMGSNDERSLCFTSEPLANDLEITGHPIASLWISSNAEDGDFFVYLEEVDEEGNSSYVTEGSLRASHRALHTPPYQYLGLPYHRSFEEDISGPPRDEPFELTLDLQPTSNIFDTGHRLRITIACCDKDNTDTPLLDPPPVIHLHVDSEHPSSIDLPVIPRE